MYEINLLLEVGSQALDDLSTTEKAAILAKYSNGQESMAGLHVFKLLSRKFKPTYRMGRMYEELSAKYDRYKELYEHYTRTTYAGALAEDVDDMTTYDVDRNKFTATTRSSDQSDDDD